MGILQSAVLGLTQGLTEFLPISSSGHLILLPRFFSWPDQGLAFDAVAHLGTLAAILIYFRKRIWMIIKSFFSRSEELKESRRLGWLILAGIVPAGFAGFFFENTIENVLRDPKIVAGSLILWAAVMYIADTVAKKKKYAGGLSKLTFLKSIFVGAAQAIALVPGTSRSGITMTAGLFSGLSRESAAEFSFLLGAPLIFGAGALKLAEVIKSGMIDAEAGVLAVGFIVSFLSGYLAIRFLIDFLKKHSLNVFVAYRVLLGILILIIL